jgi:hypothetical protein
MMNCPQCDCYCPDDAEVCACGYRFPVKNSAPVKPNAKQKKTTLSSNNKLAGTLRKIFRLAALLSLLLWVLSLLFINRLPGPKDIYAQLYREPLQNRGNVPPPFKVEKNKLTYIVTPLFNYELYGLVVSQHRSDSLLDLSHRRWQDYLNIKDLCVVWGKNISSGVYRNMEFWNRDFTCMCSFPDQETASLFSGNHLSNNHILCVDKELSRRILAARPGDQIYFKGYLVSYSQPANSFLRGTSTVRDDTGNGACETVFVTDFTILRRANRVWQILNPLAFLAAIAYLVAMLLV